MTLQWNLEAALLTMEEGDSFFIPTLNTKSLSASLRHLAKKAGVPVIVRDAVSEGAIGVRTWRVSPVNVDSDSQE